MTPGTYTIRFDTNGRSNIESHRTPVLVVLLSLCVVVVGASSLLFKLMLILIGIVALVVDIVVDVIGHSVRTT